MEPNRISWNEDWKKEKVTQTKCIMIEDDKQAWEREREREWKSEKRDDCIYSFA